MSARDYTEAKRLLAGDLDRTGEALVHAVLALAAATAESGRLDYKTEHKTSDWWTALHGEERS